MYSAHFSRLLAVPVVTAGIIGATTLGHIATARADDDDFFSTFDNDSEHARVPAETITHEALAAPNPYADPAANPVSWDQWITDGMATASQI